MTNDGDMGGEHLSEETVARLVDEVASPAERTHLEECGHCMEELSAIAAQTRALSALPDIDPPAEEWEAIEARLGAASRSSDAPSAMPVSASWPPIALTKAGRTTSPILERPISMPRRRSGWLQAAAGLALFLAGGAAGATLVSGVSSPDDVGSALPVAFAPGAVESAGDDASLSESEALVGLAENLYMDALFDYRQRVAETDPALVVRDPLGRLVMLENLLAATEAAVREAPADPFFNGVLASTTAEHRAVVARMAELTTPTW